MAKNIPAKEFKAAIKELNLILIEKGEDKIKIVNSKKEDIISEFTNCVLNFIDVDDAESLPDAVIDIYNKYIASENKEEAEEAEEKKGTKKKTSAKKTSAKNKTPPKKVGVLDSIHSTIVNNGPVSKADILKALVKKFPDREEKAMKSTINCQLSGKNRPFRLEKSRKVTYEIDKDNNYSVK